MGVTSVQVCMDSSDWFQGTMQEDSSSPSGAGAVGDIMTCSRPMMERRLRPPQDQAQKCPRCESTHTKFCYYNNYSLSQPRYFCKTCRRYWTHGGTLRNIPVGGGCRKNTHKKIKPSSSSSTATSPIISNNNNNNPTDLQLSALLGSHNNLLLNNNNNTIPNFLDCRYNAAVDFTDTKQLEALRNYDFMGNNMAPSFQGLCSPFGIMGLEHGTASASFADSCQRLMLPYDAVAIHENAAPMDVKPKLLALDQWQDQGCSDIGNSRDSFAGYLNAMGSWTGMINGYGSSASNPLV